MDDRLQKKEVNQEPDKANIEYSALVEDHPPQGKEGAEGLTSDPAEPVVGMATTVEKAVGLVWSQNYFSAKVVTNKIQGGFGAKAAR